MIQLLTGIDSTYLEVVKRNGNVADLEVGKAVGALKQKDKILAAVPAASKAEGEKLFATISESVPKIKELIGVRQWSLAKEEIDEVKKSGTKLSELIATGYKFPTPPDEFSKTLPWLKGRATVQWVVSRPGEQFDVQGTLYDKLEMTSVIDGYTAPVTAGNFIDLVDKGFYDGFKIQRSDGFVIQTGDPAAQGSPAITKKHGYVPPNSEDIRTIPLETFKVGETKPLYSATFDENGWAGSASALPFNAYGAIGMARTEDDPDSASSQYFWLLFDSDLTPGGKNLLDGRYACFGHTISNAEYLSAVQEGDVISSVKVTAGLENLVRPSS
jgi:cyclophilin family peptidyl-prolyl cis-trans isomerase